MNAEESRRLLESLSLGARVAEDEVDELADYFVETSQWKRVYAGDRDIVLGPKGAGKSALYSLVLKKSDDLFARDVLVVPAEKPEGAPVFQAVAQDPPTSEDEFEALWKLYFLSLVGDVLREYGVKNDASSQVFEALTDAGLLQPRATLANRLQAVREYVSRLFRPDAIEATVALDPNTGTPLAVTGKITLAQPSVSELQSGYRSVDALLESAEEAMADVQFSLWIALDRLDVAFARDEELERNALRALFAAYLDMKSLKRIRPKIFLRSDIWDRITSGKFAEGSHIDEEIIEWDAPGLRQLVLRRILRSQTIAEFYGVEPEEVYADVELQNALLAEMFPDKIDVGKNPDTFDWMLNRTKDGSGKPAPRELIHLLTMLQTRQLRRLEQGHEPPPARQLFERAVFKEALTEVSEVRLTKTLFAEYPEEKEFIEAMRGEKSQQSPSTLARIWGRDEAEVRNIADRLVSIGFFELRGSKEEPAYWVPFLYRDALNLVQGEARE